MIQLKIITKDKFNKGVRFWYIPDTGFMLYGMKFNLMQAAVDKESRYMFRAVNVSLRSKIRVAYVMIV